MKKVNFLLGIAIIPFIFACDDDGNSVVHHQGQNCLSCHSFTSAATIYNTLRGKYDTSEGIANGYMIQLLLDNHTTIKFRKGNGHGNVLWKGDGGSINDFTAQVIDTNGVVVNSSKLNSHNVGRLACNICHTELGLNGAPGRIVNFDTSLSKNLKIKTNN